MTKVATMKERAMGNADFMEKYTKAGLPDKRTVKHGKKTTSHGSMSPARQYSKFLQGKGLVFNYRD